MWNELWSESFLFKPQNTEGTGEGVKKEWSFVSPWPERLSHSFKKPD